MCRHVATVYLWCPKLWAQVRPQSEASAGFLLCVGLGSQNCSIYKYPLILRHPPLILDMIMAAARLLRIVLVTGGSLLALSQVPLLFLNFLGFGATGVAAGDASAALRRPFD